jgi:tripartite-type tricarboxylate transporter receptor subunit TctC
MRRRQFIAALGSVAAWPVVARAQTYPTRPVRIVVPFIAGASSDIIARLIGQGLSERLGQQFIVENRPGAGGNIGTEAVVHASPDGYTLLFAATANAINATHYEKLNFNFIRDIVPVAGLVRLPNIVEVNPAVPVKTVAELIAYAKANPGKINMATGGVGVSGHMAGELFKAMTGVDMVHVPYRGSTPALTDLIGGQVHIMFEPPAASWLASWVPASENLSTT